MEDIYKLKQKFSEIYPNNHHIEEKIRQILQAFRDVGYLKFMNNKREYKKIMEVIITNRDDQHLKLY